MVRHSFQICHQFNNQWHQIPVNQCKSRLISLSLSQGLWKSLKKLKSLKSGHHQWWNLFFRYKLLSKKQEMASFSCSETSAIYKTMQPRLSVLMPPLALQSTLNNRCNSNSLSSSSSTPRSWGSWPSRSRNSIPCLPWKPTWEPGPRRSQNRNLIRTCAASKLRLGLSSRLLWLS